jgi:hypothetical protein
MSVHRIACPECTYELMYATFGSKGSYKTGPNFAYLCARAGEIDAQNAMSCPVLRPVVEQALRSQFPGRGVAP